jgi:voltage-gated potassium channel
MSSSQKNRAWSLVDPETQNPVGKRIQDGALVLASLNVVAVVLQSVESLDNRFSLLFEGFAVVSVLLFTLFLLVRVWAAAVENRYRGSSGQVRFVRRPFVFLDFVVVVGFWLTFFLFPGTLGGVRVLWIARMLNLPRLKPARVRFIRVLSAQREDLSIAFIGSGTIALLASTLMYFVENSAQPEAFASIPAALWWGVVTLTTVGYGDVVPGTPLGRFLGAITTFGGVAFFALPSSILAAGFFAERQAKQEESTELDEVGTEQSESQESRQNWTKWELNSRSRKTRCLRNGVHTVANRSTRPEANSSEQSERASSEFLMNHLFVA